MFFFCLSSPTVPHTTTTTTNVHAPNKRLRLVQTLVILPFGIVQLLYVLSPDIAAVNEAAANQPPAKPQAGGTAPVQADYSNIPILQCMQQQQQQQQQPLPNAVLVVLQCMQELPHEERLQTLW